MSALERAASIWGKAGVAGGRQLEPTFPSPLWVDGRQEVWPADEAEAWKAQHRPK